MLEQKNTRVRADDKQVISCSLMGFSDMGMCIAQWDFLYDKKHLNGLQKESLTDFCMCFLGLIALKYLTMSSYNGLKPYINIKLSLVHAAVKDR